MRSIGCVHVHKSSWNHRAKRGLLSDIAPHTCRGITAPDRKERYSCWTFGLRLLDADHAEGDAEVATRRDEDAIGIPLDFTRVSGAAFANRAADRLGADDEPGILVAAHVHGIRTSVLRKRRPNADPLRLIREGLLRSRDAARVRFEICR